jgi:hypothetical protein
MLMIFGHFTCFYSKSELICFRGCISDTKILKNSLSEALGTQIQPQDESNGIVLGLFSSQHFAVKFFWLSFVIVVLSSLGLRLTHKRHVIGDACSLVGEPLSPSTVKLSVSE